ncbi:telomere-protecting terminal protein Tpg [Streptomyces sp. NBC_01429]|uniref:telomere-protecting terminal protein Tpg n=1 Tax=Streptomyces sp. NBC_01429 TaxID=2903862 RepID=UPI003FCD09D3
MASTSTRGCPTPSPRAVPGRPGPAGTPPDGRVRRITQHLPPAYAAQLFEARRTGADERRLRRIVAEVLQEIYFKDQGRRADDLLVEFTDIDYVELDY